MGALSYKPKEENIKKLKKFLLKLKPKYVDHKLVSGFAKMNYRKKLFDTFARIYNYHVGYGKPFKSNIFKIGSYFSDQDKRDMKYVPLGQTYLKIGLKNGILIGLKVLLIL